MPDPNVKIQFAGNAAEAERVIARLEQKVGTLDAKVKQMNRRGGSDRGFAEQIWDADKATSALIGKLAGVAGPIALATTALRTFRKEYEDLLARNAAAAGAQVQFAPALETLYTNFGVESKADRSTALKMVFDAAERAGQTLPTVSTNFADALSARGNLSKEQALEAVVTAGRFAPNTPEAQRAATGAILDIQKTVPDATPEQVVGFLQSVGQTARVTRPELIASNVAPVVASGIRVGDRPEEAAALFAALSQAMGDETGLRAGTATIDVRRQLQEATKGMGLDTTDERLRFLQANPQYMKAFLEGGRIGRNKVTGLTGEKKALDAIENMLAGGDVFQNYELAKGTLPGINDQAAGRFQALMDTYAADPVMQNAEAQRRMQAKSEMLQLQNITGARSSIDKAGLDQLLSSAGIGWTERMLAGQSFWARTTFGGMESTDAALAIVENILTSRSDSFNQGAAGIGSQGGFQLQPSTQESPIEKRLKEVIQELKSLNAAQKENKPRPTVRVGADEGRSS